MFAVILETGLDDRCVWTRRIVVEGLPEPEARAAAARLRAFPWDAPVAVYIVPVGRIGTRLANGHVRFVEEE